MFQYGDPSTSTQQSMSRPPCWGRQYNNEDKDCRMCGQQVSCREQIIRNYNQVQVKPAPVGFTNPSYQAQSSIPYYSQQVPVRMFNQPVPQTAPFSCITRQAVPMYPVSDEQYGSVPDPMFGVLANTPPPFRPQLVGETFWNRFAKNVGLALVESVLHQAILGIRQMVFPPIRRQPVIDVTPKPIQDAQPIPTTPPTQT